MPNHSKTTAYIALGSNVGIREANLRRALAILVETPLIEVRRISSFYDNPAVGGPDAAPDFVNAVAEVQTTLSATSLMKKLLEIEQQMGRVRRERWEPRVIDLDLLLYGNNIISGHDLIVPHPLMHERKFVLRPLAEIAPTAVHPTLQMTVSGLLDALNRHESGQAMTSD